MPGAHHALNESQPTSIGDQENELKRLELEERKMQSEQRFINKHLGVVLASILSLAAVIVSIGQIFVAETSKEKELSLAQIQKDSARSRINKSNRALE